MRNSIVRSLRKSNGSYFVHLWLGKFCYEAANVHKKNVFMPVEYKFDFL